MQLMFLGSGSAFNLRRDNFQSNVLLSSPGGARLLIDCGGDIRFSLSAAGLGHRDIDAVYVSHLHADHVGGLEYIGFSSKFDADRTRPVRLITCDTLVDDLWQHSLYGGMHTVGQGDFGLSSFFDVHPVAANAGFTWEGIEFRLVPTLHDRGDEISMFSYGLSFAVGRHRVFFSSDSLFQPDALQTQLREADMIFHDCETSETASGVHAHYRELLCLPADMRRRTWLYHYNDGALPDALADGFAGFVKPRQVFGFSA